MNTRIGQRALLMFALMVTFLVVPALWFQSSSVFLPGDMRGQLQGENHWPNYDDNCDEKDVKSNQTYQLNPPGFINCRVDVVEDYFSNHFRESPAKTFDVTCLKHLIDQYPANLALRTLYIRQYYLEYMATNPKRHVVYLCHSNCGGLGDRLQAMVTSFFVAMSLNATFTILTEYPVHLDEFFETSIPELSLAAPNNFLSQVGLLQHYRQSSGSSTHANGSPPFDIHTTLQGSANTSTAATLQLNQDFNFIFRDWFTRMANISEVEFFRNLNIEQEMTSAVSTADDRAVALIGTRWFQLPPYLFGNPVTKDFITRAKLTGMGKHELTFIFFQLFMSKASPFLQAAAQPYADKLAEEIPPREAKPYVVGVHLRIGDWVMKIANRTKADGRYPPKASARCMASRIRDICENKTACVVWIAGDTLSAIRYLKKQMIDSKVKILNCDEGEILHIDKSEFKLSTDPRQANIRTFLDWYILAKYVDEFVVTKSGFNEHAAYYTMKDADAFRPMWQLVQKTRGVLVCKWVDSEWLFHKGPQKPYSYYMKPQNGTGQNNVLQRHY
jgi:hypothetical protein